MLLHQVYHQVVIPIGVLQVYKGRCHQCVFVYIVAPNIAPHVDHLVIGNHILEVVPPNLDSKVILIIEHVTNVHVILRNAQPVRVPKTVHVWLVMGLGIDKIEVIIICPGIHEVNGTGRIPIPVPTPLEVEIAELLRGRISGLGQGG